MEPSSKEFYSFIDGVYIVSVDFVFSCRPYIYKCVGLGDVCKELVKLGTYGAGKVVMKMDTQS